MSLFLLNILLAIAWSALTGSFQPIDLLFGFVLGYAVLWAAFRSPQPPRYFMRIPKLIEVSLFLIWALIKANLRMAATILSPRMPLRPAVVAVPIELKHFAEVVILANMISLTPGTLSLDISSDHKTLYIHTVWLDDPRQFQNEIKHDYERRVKEVFET